MTMRIKGAKNGGAIPERGGVLSQRGGGAIPPLPCGKQGLPQGNSHPHPRGSFLLKKIKEGVADGTWTDLRSKAATTSSGLQDKWDERMLCAVADAVPPKRTRGRPPKKERANDLK